MNNKYKTINNLHQGFTLVEIMIALVIMSILLAVAIPSYNAYGRKAALGSAQQEMLKLAEQLERHKARNFSYKGFNAAYLYRDQNGGLVSGFTPANQTISFPIGKPQKFRITIVDGMASNPLLTANASLGQTWAIRAISDDARNYHLLLTSTGIQCKTLNALAAYDECDGGESW